MLLTNHGGGGPGDWTTRGSGVGGGIGIIGVGGAVWGSSADAMFVICVLTPAPTP